MFTAVLKDLQLSEADHMLHSNSYHNENDATQVYKITAVLKDLLLSETDTCCRATQS